MTEKSIFKLCSPTLTTLTNVLMQSNTKSWSAVTSDDDRAIFSSIYLILTKLWRNQLTRSSTQTASTIFDNSNNEGWSADTHNYDRTIFSTASFILTKLWPKNEFVSLFDLWPLTFDLWPLTCDIKGQSSKVESFVIWVYHQSTIDLWPLTINLWPLTFDDWPLTSKGQPSKVKSFIIWVYHKSTVALWPLTINFLPLTFLPNRNLNLT